MDERCKWLCFVLWCYQKGDVIPAGFGGTKKTYDGEPELTALKDFATSTSRENVTAEEITLANGSLGHANFGHYVYVKGVSIDMQNLKMTDGAGTAPFYNAMNANMPADLSKKYNVYAIVGSHGKTNTVYQLLPLEFLNEDGTPVDLPEVANLAELYAKTKGTNAKITGALTAVYQNGRNLYVKDDAGTFGLVYGTLSNQFVNGDQISGAVTNWIEFSGFKELIPIDASFVKSGSVSPVQPVEVALEEISQDMMHNYLVAKNVVLTVDSTNFYTMTDAEGVKMKLFNKFAITVPEIENGKKFTVKFFPTLFKGEFQLYPVEVVPENAGLNTVDGTSRVKRVEYFDTMGRQMAQPVSNGLYIERISFEDGKVRSRKVVK